MKEKTHIAVTGTKGKTTTLRTIQHVLLLNNISTWGAFGIDGRYLNGIAKDRKGDCEGYLDMGEPCEYLLSEATSYLLSREDIYQKDLNVAVFTSFDDTEHMEIHYTGKKYLEEKKKIFNHLNKKGVSIVNRDIENYEEIVSEVRSKLISYGFSKDSDCIVNDYDQNIFGSSFKILFNNREYKVETNLVSKANALNVTAAILAAYCTTGFTIEKIINDIETFPGVKGRYNMFRIPDSNMEVVIDYAHTAGSLEELLKTVRELSNKKLICIFGCGGNKSIEKRCHMGSIAEKYADQVIVTNDNPRQESPHKIANDILKNVKDRSKFEIILDRDLAIKSTLHSNHNCIIVIAGKGAESNISFGEFDFPFNDHNSVLTYAISNQYVLMKANEYVD